MRRLLHATSIALCVLAAWTACLGGPRSAGANGSRAMRAALNDYAIDELPKRISITVHTPHGDDVFIWNWLKGEFTPISQTLFQEAHATWSPDGEWLAFETTRNGPGEIYLIRPDCAHPFANCSDGLRNLTDNPGDDLYPNWSPDGQVVHYSDRSSFYDIWLTPIDGRPPVNLTNAPTEDLHPNFSPYGDTFAMRSDRFGDPDIWRVTLDTGTAVNLTATPGTDRYPNHSPDGKRVLFVSNRTGNEDLWVMREDGSEQTKLTGHPAHDYHGSWSPDGRYILFISDRRSRGDLYLMDFETGEVTLLLDLKAPIDWPFWAPTNRRRSGKPGMRF